LDSGPAELRPDGFNNDIRSIARLVRFQRVCGFLFAEFEQEYEQVGIVASPRASQWMRHTHRERVLGNSMKLRGREMKG
jgi:hypothetical protein